jgi:hypothetical protein
MAVEVQYCQYKMQPLHLILNNFNSIYITETYFGMIFCRTSKWWLLKTLHTRIPYEPLVSPLSPTSSSPSLNTVTILEGNVWQNFPLTWHPQIAVDFVFGSSWQVTYCILFIMTFYDGNKLEASPLLQPLPDFMLQGHSKIVQRCNTNSGAKASEDSSELAA